MAEYSHKGYEIRISMYDDKITCEDLELSADSVTEIKKKIDAEIRRQGSAPKFDVIYLDGYRGESPVEGVAGAYHGSGYIWVTNKKNKKRQTVSLERVWLDTQENRDAWDTYQKGIATARKLEKDAEEVFENSAVSFAKMKPGSA